MIRIADRVDDGIGPGPGALGSRVGPALADDEVLVEALDQVVRGIFSVGLTLSAARNLADVQVAARLDQALDRLDDLVRELRHATLTAHPPAGR